MKNFVVFVLLLVCSCGFEPLYKQNVAPLGKVSLSKDVFVDVIPNREGQELRSLLRKKISTADSSAKYTLKVSLNITTSDLGINIDDVVIRKVLWVRVSFNLLEGDKVLTKGTVSNNVSYAINQSEFTTKTIKNDEIEKSLIILSDDITLKIASFLKENK
jgi:hypothetical protein